MNLTSKVSTLSPVIRALLTLTLVLAGCGGELAVAELPECSESEDCPRQPFADPPHLIACGEGVGQVMSLSAGAHQLPSGCQYHGGFLITQSGTTLDCNGATLWGVPPVSRTSSTELNFESMVDAKALDPIGYGIRVVSDKPISTIVVKNCTIRAFKQAIRVKHKLSASRWLWTMAAADPTLGAPTKSYMQSPTETNKQVLLAALKGYPWSSSPLPDQIRGVTPSKVTFENVHVDTTYMSGVYVDHHVTGVTFKGLTVNRAGGPGMYLEFGTRDITVLDAKFENNGREGIAVDSSAGNLIQRSEFANNRFGGVLMYRNCWEHFTDPGVIGSATERSNYFPRTQGSDHNKIYENVFLGNGQTGHGVNVGVWVASRQSKAMDFGGHGCGLYRFKEGEPYHEDRARNALIIGNTFDGVAEGVVVEDDGARILGNRFEASVTLPVELGTVIRTKATGKPVMGGRVTFNVVYQNADQVSRDSLVRIIEQRPEFSSETRVCSLFGRANHTPSYFGQLCTNEYLSLLQAAGYLTFFQNAVMMRIAEHYPL